MQVMLVVGMGRSAVGAMKCQRWRRHRHNCHVRRRCDQFWSQPDGIDYDDDDSNDNGNDNDNDNGEDDEIEDSASMRPRAP